MSLGAVRQWCILWLLVLASSMAGLTAINNLMDGIPGTTALRFSVATQAGLDTAFNQIFSQSCTAKATEKCTASGTKAIINFRGSNRLYRLLATGIISTGSAVRLNASATLNGVTLMPPAGQSTCRHFTIKTAEANLTAIKVNFKNAYIAENSNAANTAGGSLYIAGTLKAINCTWENNTVVNTHAAGVVYGGAIYAESTARLVLNNTIFRSNQARSTHYVAAGGAICTAGGASVTLRSSTIVDNTATGGPNGWIMGGAVYVTGGTLKAINSAFVRNTARSFASTSYRSKVHRQSAQGGGIHLHTQVDARIENCTFAANRVEATISQANTTSLAERIEAA